MDSDCSSRSQLCKRCSTWDFGKLFQGYSDGACHVGPFQDPENPQTWDVQPLQEVQHNINCNFCQFVYSIISISSPWEKSLKLNSKLYIHYRKQWLGHRSISANSKLPITTLALEIIDDPNPTKCSLDLFSSESPNLQCFRFDSSHRDSPLNGMMAGRRIGAQINFVLVDYWISSCNGHGAGCSKPTLPEPVRSNIRLIDIKARRLVWARTSYTYAALSYMWGPPSLQQARLTRSTEAELFSEGSLGDGNDTVPRTIRDAIIVCERLRIPYLWVDALCIEQDSPDFSVHLQRMNDIYAAAYLTIVAASGTDSWAGLPGVMPNSRDVYQPSIIVRNIGIGLAVPEFWNSVVNSPWADRAWTFQERLFSNRMLIFAQSQCFFYCDKSSRFESTITEIGDGAEEIPYSLLSTLEWVEMRTKFKGELFGASTKESLRAYFKLIRNYRRLTLTYQTDVLRAFSGVMAAFERQMSTSFYFGLPLSMFTWALLMDYTHCVRRPEFPSWTWAGWSEDRLEFEDSSYIGDIFIEFRTTTIFYRLHPTSDDTSAKEIWALEDIHDSQSPGALDLRLNPQLVHQSLQVPAHLDGMSLEKLLVFDAPASKIEVQESNRHLRENTGRLFDIEYKMNFVNLLRGSLQDNIGLHYAPYIPSSYFSGDLANASVSKTMEFVQIGMYYKYYPNVCLMLVDTDERGISTRVSLCTMKESVWLSNNPERKRFYLM